MVTSDLELAEASQLSGLGVINPVDQEEQLESDAMRENKTHIHLGLYGFRTPLLFLGLAIVAGTLYSAIETFVLPRSANDPLTRLVFLSIRGCLICGPNAHVRIRTRSHHGLLRADHSALAPTPVWLVLVLLGYTGMFRALGVPSWRGAFTASGSSLLTLGFAPLDDLPKQMLAFSEATIGLGLVALLIAYLPTMYSGVFSTRSCRHHA